MGENMQKNDHMHLYRFYSLLSIMTIAFAVFPRAAYAQEIPFFSIGPKIDEKTWYISHGWANGAHQSCEWRKYEVRSEDDKLVLGLSDHGGKERPISCGEIRTRQTYSYGRYEVRMKTAAGSGLNTNFFTYTGPPYGVKEHDEIDFEFLGKEPDKVEAVFWRNGKKAKIYKIPLGFDSSKEFHNYAFEWDQNEIRWFVDGKLMHQSEKGADIPVNSQHIFLSLWSGGQSVNDWLGPFSYKEPLSAEVEWVKYTPLEELHKEE